MYYAQTPKKSHMSRWPMAGQDKPTSCRPSALGRWLVKTNQHPAGPLRLVVLHCTCRPCLNAGAASWSGCFCTWHRSCRGTCSEAAACRHLRKCHISCLGLRRLKLTCTSFDMQNSQKPFTCFYSHVSARQRGDLFDVHVHVCIIYMYVRIMRVYMYVYMPHFGINTCACTPKHDAGSHKTINRALVISQSYVPRVHHGHHFHNAGAAWSADTKP